ncbi:MAG: c-type cytochrome biogenesis protein CcmI [Shimia sp.]
MIGVWITALLLALASGAFLVRGAGGGARALTRRDGAAAILRDQLAEVESDRDQGLISGDEAQAARVEIERRLLAAARAAAEPDTSGDGGRRMIAAAAAVVAISLPLYALIGAPGVESRPFADRGEERADEAEVAGLIAQLIERLEADPDGGPIEGWVLLGQTYMGRGRYPEAAAAFARVADRDEADSSVLSRYAEALIAAENGVVTSLARAAIDRSLDLDDRNPAATFYRAQALEQDGALVAARSLLVERLRTADGFQPWMGVFVAEANRIGEQTGDAPIDLAVFAPTMSGEPGPDAVDVAAAEAMTGEERMAFVRSMVDGLAARLEDEPDDVDGWFRIIRAYEVLGEAEALQHARVRARRAVLALPEDDPRRAGMLAVLGPSAD